MKNEKESKQPIVALEEHYKHILELIGEDCNRPGLERTPQRVAQAMCELTSGYNEDPSAELINSSFKEEYQRMVIVKDIRFFFNVRTSPTSILWKGACGIYSQPTRNRIKQDSTCSGYF